MIGEIVVQLIILICMGLGLVWAGYRMGFDAGVESERDRVASHAYRARRFGGRYDE